MQSVTRSVKVLSPTSVMRRDNDDVDDDDFHDDDDNGDGESTE